MTKLKYFIRQKVGRFLTARQRKYARYFLVRGREALGLPYFPALHGLDRKLLPYLSKLNDGIFIEAGANDGLNQSNTWYLEKTLKWKGLLIEPIPEMAELCRKFRSAKVYCTALGNFDQDGTSLRLHFGGLMTAAEGADEAHLESHSVQAHARAGADWVGGKSYEFESPVASLSSLIDRARLSKVDLLSLDVEGFEVNVLRGIDFDRHPIRYILVETSNLPEVVRALGDRYRLVDQLSYHDYLFAITDQ